MNNCQQQKARSSSKLGCFLKTTFSECASDTNTPFEQKRTIPKQPKIGKSPAKQDVRVFPLNSKTKRGVFILPHLLISDYKTRFK